MFFVSYQQGVTASHDAKAQAGVALGDIDGGLTAGDDGTGCRVAGQSGRRGRATLTLIRECLSESENMYAFSPLGFLKPFFKIVLLCSHSNFRHFSSIQRQKIHPLTS